VWFSCKIHLNVYIFTRKQGSFGKIAMRHNCQITMTSLTVPMVSIVACAWVWTRCICATCIDVTRWCSRSAFVDIIKEKFDFWDVMEIRFNANESLIFVTFLLPSSTLQRLSPQSILICCDKCCFVLRWAGKAECASRSAKAELFATTTILIGTAGQRKFSLTPQFHVEIMFRTQSSTGKPPDR